MTVLELHTSQEASPYQGEVFTTGEIADFLGLSTDEVDYWTKCRLIAPSVRAASGHGSRRLFNRNDLRQAFLVQRLRTAHWKPKQIVRALSAIEAALKDPASLHAPILVHENNALLIVCRNRGKDLSLLDAAKPGQYVMVIALETLEDETRRILAKSK